MNKTLRIVSLLMLGFALVLSGCGTNNGDTAGEKPSQLSIVTGGTGGTYYPLGGEIAGIITDKTGIETTAQSSGASVENMQTLQAGEADLAFTQTDIANYAINGQMMFEGGATDNIRAIGALYPETIQIVTSKDSGITSVEDLRGKKVSVGAPGSGTFANAEQVLEVHGLTMEDINAQHLSFDESTEGIQDGNIDAAFITAGTPTGAVEGLSAIKPVQLLQISDDKANALIEKYPYYAKDTVKAGTYGLESDVTTVAVKAMLVVRADLSDDAVYDLTKALFDNVGQISHAKGQFISAENALAGVGIEIHPGAKRYFEEKGQK
jgi:TRAP transporter TAXI family solute receptor